MDGFVILVRFKIASGHRDEFLKHVLQNATASVESEAGCRRFDVLADEADASDEFVLYEIYDDAEAFERHLETAHFAAFRVATKPLVLSSAVERLQLREHARQE